MANLNFFYHEPSWRFFGGHDESFCFLLSTFQVKTNFARRLLRVTALARGDKRQLSVSTIRIHNRAKLDILQARCLLLQFRAFSTLALTLSALDSAIRKRRGWSRNATNHRVIHLVELFRGRRYSKRIVICACFQRETEENKKFTLEACGQAKQSANDVCTH